ncbi:hypothetical protein [Xanthomonas hydrangeae]|uniref:hypothetical protein n=1 Tax=Xanthomonas hydrangeae TaxID=2775159 RepID=UPI001964E453
MSKDATILLFRCLTASTIIGAATATARQPAPIEAWPLQQQHLLAGRYTGKLQPYTQDCQAVRADLVLHKTGKPSDNSRRYTLKTTCIAGAARHTAPKTMVGSWWIDQIGGSCLMLSFEDPNDPMIGPNIYGFRIEQDTISERHAHRTDYALAQDGHNCHSGNPPEDQDKVLRRVR